MRRQLLPALVAFLAITVLTGLAYPLAVTGIAQVAFPSRADGSLVERDGTVVGSKLLAQAFEGERYFHPRPSAAGDGYDAMSSSASNLGPLNEELLTAVDERRQAYREANDCRGAGRRADRVGVRSRPAHLAGERPSPSRSGRRGSGPRPGAGARADRRAHRRPFARLPRRAGRERARAQPRAGRGVASIHGARNVSASTSAPLRAWGRPTRC